MADRLGLLKQPPRRAAMWWPHPSGLERAARRALPEARWQEVMPQVWRERQRVAPPWWAIGRLFGRQRDESVAEAEVEPGSVDLLWSNMALHAVPDPAEMLARWHHALAVDGCLMFSTLGPGTLPELRQLFAQQQWGPAMAPLVDMHDLGDLLVRQGFADPVMDQETLVLTWPDAASALTELRALGGNADPSRFAGLRTRCWRDRLLQALHDGASRRADGRIALSFEVAYGHAWRVAPRRRTPSEATVSLESLRASAPSRGAPSRA